MSAKIYARWNTGIRSQPPLMKTIHIPVRLINVAANILHYPWCKFPVSCKILTTIKSVLRHEFKFLFSTNAVKFQKALYVSKLSVSEVGSRFFLIIAICSVQSRVITLNLAILLVVHQTWNIAHYKRIGWDACLYENTCYTYIVMSHSLILT